MIAAASFAAESSVVYYVGSNDQNGESAEEVWHLLESSSDYDVVFLNGYEEKWDLADTTRHVVVPSVMLLNNTSGELTKLQLRYIMKNADVASYVLLPGNASHYCVDFKGNTNSCMLERYDAHSYFSLGSVITSARENGFNDGDSLSLIFTPVEQLGKDDFNKRAVVDYDLDYSEAIKSGSIISAVVYGTDVSTGRSDQIDSVTVRESGSRKPESIPLADKMQVHFFQKKFSPYYKFKDRFKVRFAFATDGKPASASSRLSFGFTWPKISDFVNSVIEGENFSYEIETDDKGFFSLKELLAEVYAAVLANSKSKNISEEDVVFALRVIPVFEPVKYPVTFDNNTDATVFYSEQYLWSFNSELVFDDYFAYPVFRADGKCFAGWSFDPQGENSLYGQDYKVGEDWINFYESGKRTLYAVWKDQNESGKSCGSVTVPLYTDGNGVLELYQVVESTGYTVRFKFDAVSGKDYTHQIVLPDAAAMGDYYASIPFRKNAVPNTDDYASYSVTFKRNGGLPENFYDNLDFNPSNPETVPESFSAKFVPKGPYTINFQYENLSPQDLYVANAYSFDDYANVAVQDSLPVLCTAMEQEGSSLEGYCIYNWDYNGPGASGQNPPFTTFDENLYDLANTGDVLGKVIPLVAEGENETIENHVAIVSENYGYAGSVKLVQKINGKEVSREVGSDSLRLSGIPRNWEVREEFAFVFSVVAEPGEGYMLDGRIEVGVTPASTGNTDYEDLESGDHYWFKGSRSEESIAYALKADFVRYEWMSLDFNSDDDYFVWGDEDADKRKIPASRTQIPLPTNAYTSETCLLGWSFDKKATDYDYRVMTYGYELFNKMRENGSDKLYAVWGDIDACGIRCKPDCDFDKMDNECCEGGNGYVVARLESEHGSVEFVDTENGNQIHSFNKNGEMLLPHGGSFNGNSLIIHAIPDDGYKLDSLVYTTLGGTGEHYELHDGEALTSSQGCDALYKAYYSKTGPDLPGDPGAAVLELSGNYVRFSYPADSVKPGMRLVGELFADYTEDPVRNFVYEEGKADADLLPWRAGPLKTGFYLLNVWLVSGPDSTLVYSRDFEVESRIAADCPGCWFMVSLYNVDFEKFGWAGDPVFYWWDETKNYGHYWQYQDFVEGSEVDPARGYWYNSDEGLGLTLKEEYEEPENSVWHLENVYSGWNMVANPYGWSVEVMDYELAKRSGNEDVEFMRWNAVAADYEPVDVVGPYEAVWVHVDEPMDWRLPSEPVFTDTVDANGDPAPSRKAPKPAALAKAAGIGEWSIQASLADNNGKTDAWNVMGVGESAKIALEPPAGLGSRVNFSIVEGGMGLMKSIKAATDASEYEWTVELSATTARTGHLSFAGVDALRASGLRLFVTVDGNTTEMTEGKPLDIALGEKVKVATVRAAPTARTVVASKLNGLRAVRVADRLLVDFSATEGLAGANARVELLDVNGNVVGNAELSAAAGANSVSLVAPRHGLYIVRVRCASQVAVAKIAVR